MPEVKKGDVVKVHYTGRLSDQTVFDSSREREPIEFTVGGGQMIKGFDNAVEGMEVGEKKEIKIGCDEAYGERKDEAIITIKKSQLPAELEPEVGMQLEATQENGQKQMLLIHEIKGEDIVLDGNHPLAGKELFFDIEVMEIKS